MAEPATTQPTADATATAPEAAPADPSPPAAAAVEEPLESPFPEGTLAKRPDLAAKYGKKSKGKKEAAESKAAATGDDATSDGGPTPEAAEPAKTEAEPSKFESQLAELARHAEDPEVARELLASLLTTKSAAGAVAAAARRFKKARQAEAKAEHAIGEAKAVKTELDAALAAFKADPHAFAKKNGFDYRDWLTKQVEEENLSPEAKRLRNIELRQAEQAKEAAELKAWKAEVAEREQKLRAAEADRGALDKLRGYLATETEQQAYPHVFAAWEASDLATGVWDKVKAHYLETGVELDWREILRHEDDRLRQIHERLSRAKRTDQPASNGAGRSEREGAVKSAKPGGRGSQQEPSSLSNADASERVSEAKRPRNREEHLDQILRRHGVA